MWGWGPNQGPACHVGEIETSRIRQSPGTVLKPVRAGDTCRAPVQERSGEGEMAHVCAHLHVTCPHPPVGQGSPADLTRWLGKECTVVSAQRGGGGWHCRSWSLECSRLAPPVTPRSVGCSALLVSGLTEPRASPRAPRPAGWAGAVCLLEISSLVQLSGCQLLLDSATGVSPGLEKKAGHSLALLNPIWR